MTWKSWIGLAVVVGTHVAILQVDTAEMSVHAWINLGAAALIVADML